MLGNSRGGHEMGKSVRVLALVSLERGCFFYLASMI